VQFPGSTQYIDVVGRRGNGSCGNAVIPVHCEEVKILITGCSEE